MSTILKTTIAKNGVIISTPDGLTYGKGVTLCLKDEWSNLKK